MPGKGPFTIRQRKDRKKVQLDIWVNGGRRRLLFDSWDEANREGLRLAQQSSSSGVQAVDSTNEAALTIKQLCLLLLLELEHDGRKSSTISNLRYRFKKHVIPYLGEIEARRISPRVLSEWQAHLDDEKKVSLHERRRMLRLLGQVFNFAVEQNYVDLNPVKLPKGRKAKLPRVRPSKSYEVKEQRVILDKLRLHGGQEYGYVLTLIRTGMRPIEALNFQFSWISYAEGLIYIPSTLDFSAKDGDSREVPLASDLREWLRSLGRQAGYVFLSSRKYKTHGGAPRPLKDPAKLIRRIRKVLGFHLKPYDLRHTFASTMIAMGVKPAELQAIMGHTRFSTTERYLHKQKDYLGDARRVLAELTCPQPVPKSEDQQSMDSEDGSAK